MKSVGFARDAGLLHDLDEGFDTAARKLSFGVVPEILFGRRGHALETVEAGRVLSDHGESLEGIGTEGSDFDQIPADLDNFGKDLQQLGVPD